MAKAFTEEEFGKWIPAPEAHDPAQKAFASRAASEILARLTKGLILARCENLFLNGQGSPEIAPFVPPVIWKTIEDTRYPNSLPLWISGTQSFEHRRSYNESTDIEAFGIRFDPAGMAKMLPAPVPKSPPPSPPPQPDAATAAPAKHAGGAPRKEFWDDLWLAMFERLWLTDWKPKNQTEIENAMLDWASGNGHELGPTSVKKPAKKLFDLIQK